MIASNDWRQRERLDALSRLESLVLRETDAHAWNARIDRALGLAREWDSIDRIARERPIVVFGRNKVLDFTYVDDCTAGVLAGVDALVERRVTDQTINVAFGHGSTLVDVVNLISLALGREAKATYEPSRPGEVTRYVADIAKARELLGYEPQTPLSGGIGLAVKWQRETGVLKV